MSSSKLAPTFFVFSGVFAGGLHYLFQVYASRHLSSIDFGLFNAWVANTSLFFVFSTLAQNFSVFYPLKRTSLTQIFLIFSVLSICGYFFLSLQNLSDSVLTILFSVIFSFYFGQALGRQFFYIVGAAQILVAGFKFGKIWIENDHTLESYKTAVCFSFFVGILPIFIALLINSKNPQQKRKSFGLRESFFSTLMLGFLANFIPQMDIYYAQITSNVNSLSQTSFMALFSKGLFFFVLLVMQVLLPKQLETPTNTQNKVQSRSILQKRFWFYSLVASFVAGAVAYFVIPYLGPQLLKPDFELSANWSGLLGMNVVLATVIYVAGQTLLTQKKLRMAFFLTGILPASLLVISLFSLDITRYLLILIFIQASALFIVARNGQKPQRLP